MSQLHRGMSPAQTQMGCVVASDIINQHLLNSLIGPYRLIFIIEVMHKACHDTSAVKVGHFEWLTMYTGVTGQKRAKPVSLKQATIP